MTLKKIHFYIGLIVIAHFIITGFLMKQNFFSIEPQDTLVRMMLRANHIYILFCGLIHLLISYTFSKNKPIGALHFVSGSIIIVATIGINMSFYIDPIKHLGLETPLIQRTFTGYAIIGCLIGTGLHLLLAHFYQQHKAPAPVVKI